MANSYILLTANLEDVDAIAKQIAASPVAHQINKIMRRASNVFNEQMDQSRDYVQWRADNGQAPNGQREHRGRTSSSKERASGPRQQPQRRRSEELAALGKNASYYLASINKILQNV